jgi:hypothetical protein
MNKPDSDTIEELQNQILSLNTKLKDLEMQSNYTVMDNMTLLSELNAVCYLKRKEQDEAKRKSMIAKHYTNKDKMLQYNVYFMNFYELEEVYNERLEIESLRLTVEDIVDKHDPYNPKRFKLAQPAK